jgi:hypothetical protein
MTMGGQAGARGDQRLAHALRQLASALGPDADWAQAQALVRGALGLAEVDAEQCLRVCCGAGLAEARATFPACRQQDASCTRRASGADGGCSGRQGDSAELALVRAAAALYAHKRSAGGGGAPPAPGPGSDLAAVPHACRPAPGPGRAEELAARVFVPLLCTERLARRRREEVRAAPGPAARARAAAPASRDAAAARSWRRCWGGCWRTRAPGTRARWCCAAARARCRRATPPPARSCTPSWRPRTTRRTRRCAAARLLPQGPRAGAALT